MQVYDLARKVKPFVSGTFYVKLGVLLGTIAIAVAAVLGAFYFQLMRNALLANVIAGVACIVPIGLFILSQFLGKKGNYKSILITSYVATGIDTKEYAGKTAQLLQEAEELTKDTIGGVAGYKQALAENKELLNYMMDNNCACFDEFKNQPKPLQMLAKFRLSHWNIFGIVDCIFANNMKNSQYRILSSTRWYPGHVNYTKSMLEVLYNTVGPVIIGLILFLVANGVCGQYAFTGLITFSMFVALLSVAAQAFHIGGDQRAINTIVSDMTEPNAVKPASFEVCSVFANASPGYRKLCVANGFIKGDANEGQDATQSGDNNQNVSDAASAQAPQAPNAP